MNDELMMIRTAQYLTGHELYRVLNGRLSCRVLAALWTAEGEEADYNREIYGEQMAEHGSARRRYTRLEAYLNANPVHTCAAKPAGWDLWPMDDEDIPF